MSVDVQWLLLLLVCLVCLTCDLDRLQPGLFQVMEVFRAFLDCHFVSNVVLPMWQQPSVSVVCRYSVLSTVAGVSGVQPASDPVWPLPGNGSVPSLPGLSFCHQCGITDVVATVYVC
jgi:hypothetical protein